MKGHAMTLRAWAGLLLAVVVSPVALAAEAKLEPINVGQPQKIEVFPAAIKLLSKRDSTRVVVTGYYADGSIQDLTRAAEVASTNGAVFEVVNRWIRPKS